MTNIETKKKQISTDTSPKLINYKIKKDQLWAQIEGRGPIWYLVTCSTYPIMAQTSNNLMLDSIGLGRDEPSKGPLENGLKIRLSGRIRGVRMARKIEEHVGVGLRTQSIEWAIEEENRQIYTKWGTIGIKVSRGGAKER